MGFTLYCLTMALWFLSGAVAVVSGFDLIPTMIAAVCLLLNMAVVRFA